MAIGIIPKKREEEEFSIRKIALYIGLGLLFLSVAGSAVLFILTHMASRDIEEVRATIETNKELEKPLFEQMMDHYRRVMDFNFLLNTRVSPIPVFEIMERVVHPDVYFTELRINTPERSVTTTGMARNITAFDQQIRIWQEEPMIVNIVIDSFTRKDDGQVIFPIVLTFSEELFLIQ